jgi:tRNA1Val (adenine37-N6)-methyltransferase
MKVGTDGVLLGAWARVDGALNILDVGSGTGLIALMLAQRAPDALIHALDIDFDAFSQAQENVKASKFSERISLFHTSLQAFQSNQKYDIIASNPPYFSRAFKPKDESRAKARHTDSLSLKELFFVSKDLLAEDGTLSIIIPSDNYSEAMEEANQHGFSMKRLCRVYPKPQKPEKRIMAEFLKGPAKTGPMDESLIIEEEGRHQYSEAYKALTKDFYLNF